MRRAWVTILNGRLEGQNRTIDPSRSATTLGRADTTSIVLLGDPTIAAIHAAIVSRDGRLSEPREGTVAVEREGKVEATGPCALAPEIASGWATRP